MKHNQVEIEQLADNLMSLTPLIKKTFLEQPVKNEEDYINRAVKAVAFKVEQVGNKTKDFKDIDVKSGDIITIGRSIQGSNAIRTPNGLKLVVRINTFIAKVKVSDELEEFSQEI